MKAAFYSVFGFTRVPVVVVHIVSLDVLASNLSIWCPLSSSLWIVCPAWMGVTVRQERQAEDVKMKCITRDRERRKEAHVVVDDCIIIICMLIYFADADCHTCWVWSLPHLCLQVQTPRWYAYNIRYITLHRCFWQASVSSFTLHHLYFLLQNATYTIACASPSMSESLTGRRNHTAVGRSHGCLQSPMILLSRPTGITHRGFGRTPEYPPKFLIPEFA